jgi:quercetin dioxygenase-like cupin family protein
MKIQPKAPSFKGSVDIVKGDVWFDVIARGEEPSRVRMGIGHFAPGARTAWHAHAIGQTLHIIEGICRIQSRGEDIVELRAGDTVFTPAGEWHWHGASADRYMSHLSVSEAPQTGDEAQWGDHVTDEEYAGK